MATSVSVTKNTREKLQLLKIEEGLSCIDELLKRLIIQYRKNKLLESSKKFKERMDELDLSVEDLIE